MGGAGKHRCCAGAQSNIPSKPPGSPGRVACVQGRLRTAPSRQRGVRRGSGIARPH